MYIDHWSLQHRFKQKDLNLMQWRWLELWKDYYITNVCHPRKANMVVDALSRKAENMGSLSFIPDGERTLAIDVQDLANKFSYLFEHIKAHQYDDPHFLVLMDTMDRGGAREMSIADDGVLLLEGQICVPNVDRLRELIL
ncbi:uncharacterized protein [Nicotiana tomentosiformis]|uniref:uncharacterized protein n=1 Tax=Nicotiana tomentosiformis TaxID=4098 RepID=UPI00388C54B6